MSDPKNTEETKGFLPDFPTCPIFSKQSSGRFQIKFQISASPIVYDQVGLILQSHRMEVGEKYFDEQYVATIHANGESAKPILHVLDLIRLHVKGISEHSTLPLVLDGSFRIGKSHDGPLETFRPFILKNLGFITVAFLTVPAGEVKQHEKEIVERLNRYIQVSI